MKTVATVALLACAPLVLAAGAAETPSVASLQNELQALRAQNATLQRENAELKAQLAGGKPAAVVSTATVASPEKAQDGVERQEDKPHNRIRLPSNVTINHNPR